MNRLFIASTFLLAAAALPVALETPKMRTGNTISTDPTLYVKGESNGLGTKNFAEGESNGFGTKNFAEGESNGLGTKNFAEGESNGFGTKNFAMAGVEEAVFRFGPLMPQQWLG